MNEPITDHMRAILDGHIVLSREIAARGHHPSVDVLQSTSRLMSHLASDSELAVAAEVRRQLALYEGSRDLIELGAHQRDANPVLDRAVDLRPALDAALAQTPEASISRIETYRRLAEALAGGGVA